MARLLLQKNFMKDSEKRHIETVQQEEGYEEANLSLLNWCDKADEEQLNFFYLDGLRTQQIQIFHIVEDSFFKAMAGYIHTFVSVWLYILGSSPADFYFI